MIVSLKICQYISIGIFELEDSAVWPVNLNNFACNNSLEVLQLYFDISRYKSESLQILAVLHHSSDLTRTTGMDPQASS